MIFGEPTNNEMIVGSKGLLEYEINFSGIKVHSGNPEKGKSANMNAVKFLMELDVFYKQNIRCYEDKNYEISYTTMNVGIINGGSAKNSVAANCNVSIDFRLANKEHIDIIKKEIDFLAKKYDCKPNIIECIDPFINKSELVDEVKTFNYITEASLINTDVKIILGAGPITAHEVDEFITKESYDKLVEQYKEIIYKYG